MFHPHSSPGLPGSLKRFHEDDTDDMSYCGAGGFGEHRNKRHHVLPLRSSPLSKRASPPPSFQSTAFFATTCDSPPRNITPVSDTEGTTSNMGFQSDSYNNACSQGWSYAEPPSIPLPQVGDMDMDMGMGGVELMQNGGQTHLRPGPFQPDPIGSDITGRMPTPIQPSFAAQVRGNNWGGGAGNVMQAGCAMRCPGSFQIQLDEHNGATPSSEEPGILNYGATSSWNPLQNRPLPSPISESGGEDVGSPDMILDSVSHFRAQHAAAFSNMPPRSESTRSLPSYLQAVSESAEQQQGSPPADGAHAMETDPPITPSPRKGHTRSRHTVNNWTAQPGMKKSFSIGYRADCEKCRNKVPGHFNHIIVS